MRSLRTHLNPRWISLSLALSFALALNALAEAPKTMNAQGVLRDGSGAAVADGDHTVVFKLYETATGGSAIWEESQLISTSNGLFNAVLGNTTSLAGLDFESPYYMSMAVDGGSEMSPRIPLTAVAYSFLAHNVSDGSVTSSKIVDGAVNGLKLADDAVSTSKMEDGAVTSSKLASDASVLSLNTLKGDVTLAASGGATIQTDGNTIMINAGSGTGTEAGVQGIQNTDGTMTVADANGPT
ncbi:MAG: hypothetical protein HKN21_04880, partial [Candidatus Eisenbacteria bacterium]|nr:hypothetical protein [Candidatus Eisenbacteria bacterium]